MPSAEPPSRAASPIVRLVDVHKSFGDLDVLKGITLDFLRGRATVVLGPSGCGKSVMLKHIVGLLRPDRGEVWYDDQRIDRLPETQLGPIRRQFGFLFQQSALFDSMSVRDNVAFPLVEHTALSADDREQRVRDVLRLVGLDATIDAMPASLSGGQRKRVALARAIVLEPKVVLYDEPTTGLDPIRADAINDLIIKLNRDANITTIVVTHDLHSAFRIADRMVMLHEGEVILEGDPTSFRHSDNEIVSRFLSTDGPPGDEAADLDAVRASHDDARGSPLADSPATRAR